MWLSSSLSLSLSLSLPFFLGQTNLYVCLGLFSSSTKTPFRDEKRRKRTNKVCKRHRENGVKITQTQTYLLSFSLLSLSLPFSPTSCDVPFRHVNSFSFLSSFHFHHPKAHLRIFIHKVSKPFCHSVHPPPSYFIYTRLHNFLLLLPPLFSPHKQLFIVVRKK